MATIDLLLPFQTLQQPQIVPLALPDHVGEQVQEGRQVAGIARPDRRQVLAAQNRRDDGHRVARLEQGQVHQQPGGPAVAVHEGVDADQPIVQEGRVLDGVLLRPQAGNLLDEGGHQPFELARGGEDEVGPGDDDVLPAVVAGVGRIDAVVEELVQLQDVLFGDLLAAGEFLQVVEGLGVADCLEVVPERFAADGDAVLDHHLGLGLGQAVSFQGVARPGQADAEVFPQLFKRLALQRAVAVDLLLEIVSVGDAIGELHDFPSNVTLQG